MEFLHHIVEMRFKTDQLQSQSLIENEPHWNLQLEYQRGNIGILKFSSSFGELETESGSLFNNEFTQLVVNVNHHSVVSLASESIEIVALQDFQSRIRMLLVHLLNLLSLLILSLVVHNLQLVEDLLVQLMNLEFGVHLYQHQ